MRLNLCTAACRTLLGVVTAVTAVGAPTATGPATAPADTEADRPDARIAEQYQFAEGLRSRGYLDLAVAEYKKLVDNAPTSEHAPMACYNWARSLQGLGRHDDAVAVFERLRRTYPTHDIGHEAAIGAARILLKQDKLDEAVALLLAARKNGSVPPPVLEAIDYYLGDIAFKQDDVKTALRYLAPLAAKPLEPSFDYRVYARLTLGYLHRKLDRPNAARRYFESLLADGGVPKAVLEESLVQAANLAYTQSHYADAGAYYTRIVEEFPDGRFFKKAAESLCWSLYQAGNHAELDTLLRSPRFRAAEPVAALRYVDGLNLKAMDRHEQALAAFDAALGGDCTPAVRLQADYEAIECLYVLNRYDACLKRSETFVATHLGSELAPHVDFIRGQCLIELNQTGEARKVFRRLLEQQGEDWQHAEDAVRILADLSRRDGDSEEAAAYYRQLAEKATPDRRAALFLRAAECEMARGDPAAALPDFLAVTESTPTPDQRATALFKIAEIHTLKQDYPAGIAVLDELLRDFPDADHTAEALRLRGVLHYNLERYTEAITDLRACLDRTNAAGRATAQLHLVYALWAAHEEKDALALLPKLLADTEFDRASLDPALLEVFGRRYIALNKYDAATRCFSILREHSDTGYQVSGLIGLGHMHLTKGKYDEAVEWLLQAKNTSHDMPEKRGNALSLLGETLALQGRSDEALLIYKEALELNFENVAAKARTRLGIARLHVKNKAYAEALPFAISVFVLFDDPRYTPEAMLLAMEIFLLQDRTDDAGNTYNELSERYPAALASFRNREENKPIFDTLESHARR